MNMVKNKMHLIANARLSADIAEACARSLLSAQVHHQRSLPKICHKMRHVKLLLREAIFALPSLGSLSVCVCVFINRIRQIQVKMIHRDFLASFLAMYG